MHRISFLLWSQLFLTGASEFSPATMLGAEKSPWGLWGYSGPVLSGLGRWGPLTLSYRGPVRAVVKPPVPQGSCQQPPEDGRVLPPPPGTKPNSPLQLCSCGAVKQLWVQEFSLLLPSDRPGGWVDGGPVPFRVIDLSYCVCLLMMGAVFLLPHFGQ